MSVHVPHAARWVAAVLVSLVALTLPLAADAQPKSASLQWRTYVGGPGSDRVTAVAQASNGDVLVAGVTRSLSLDEPATGGVRNSEDYFIARFTSSGSRVWVRTYGGDFNTERISAITITPTNDIYIVGSTDNQNITGVGTVYEGGRGGEEGFLSKIDYASGISEWFLYVSGNSTETATGVVVTSDGIYVTGSTNSSNFLGYSVPLRGGDAFVLKVDPANPGVFPWATTPFRLIGGAGQDDGNGITVDGNKLLVVGTTRSNPISTNPVPVTGFHGVADAFVARLDASSGALEWVTNVGGAQLDEGTAIAVHPVSHQIAVAGNMTSTEFGGPPAPSGRNAFAAWLATTGAAQMSPRVLGGASEDVVVSVAFDSASTTYLSGTTESADLPVTVSNALDTSIESGTGLREGFVAAFPAAGGGGWVSFFGGDATDTILGMNLTLPPSAPSTSPRLVLALQTSSGTGFPTPIGSAYDPNLSTPPDGYVAALTLTDITPPSAGIVNDRPGPDTVNADIDVQDFSDALSANWNGFTHPAGIARYEWALGTVSSPEAIQSFTSVGTSTFATRGMLNLQVGTRYYTTVRAQSPYGITTTSRSNGVLVRDAGTSPPDGGPGTPDAGIDGGVGTPDAGIDGGPRTPDAGIDGGVGTPDAGIDGGVGSPDAGIDGGVGTPDAGADGGPGIPDAGIDGGTGMPDSGTETPDSGTGGDDGGMEEGEPRSPIGCGCSSEGGAGVPLLLGLMLLALRVRRSHASFP